MMEINQVRIDPRAFRLLRGARSQKAMAALLGTSAMALSNIERGRSRPPGEILLRALLISGMSPWDLVGRDVVDDVRLAVQSLPPE